MGAARDARVDLLPDPGAAARLRDADLQRAAHARDGLGLARPAVGPDPGGRRAERPRRRRPVDWRSCCRCSGSRTRSRGSPSGWSRAPGAGRRARPSGARSSSPRRPRSSALAAYVLYPNGEYRPIQPNERGTVQGGVAQLSAVRTGRPALTEEREEELGGAPTVRSGGAPLPSEEDEAASRARVHRRRRRPDDDLDTSHRADRDDARRDRTRRRPPRPFRLRPQRPCRQTTPSRNDDDAHADHHDDTMRQDASRSCCSPSRSPSALPGLARPTTSDDGGDNSAVGDQHEGRLVALQVRVLAARRSPARSSTTRTPPSRTRAARTARRRRSRSRSCSSSARRTRSCPRTYAIAINENCTLCQTFATAFQFVIGVEDASVGLTEGGQARAARDPPRVQGAQGTRSYTLEEFHARTQALGNRLRTVLKTQLVSAAPRR